MNVMLADDQTQVRSALRLLLEQDPDFEIAGETADATGLLQAVDRKTPDIVLLDWELPGLPPEQLLRLLNLGFPSVKVIVMSTQPQDEKQALGAGAHAFLSKSSPPNHIETAIRGLFS
jgi:DNA-binding NarL/FixJ family response regulator